MTKTIILVTNTDLDLKRAYLTEKDFRDALPRWPNAKNGKPICRKGCITVEEVEVYAGNPSKEVTIPASSSS